MSHRLSASSAHRLGWFVLLAVAAAALPAQARDKSPQSAETLAKNWDLVDQQHAEGWKDETFTPARFAVPAMTKTAARVEAIRHWLKTDAVAATRAKAKDDPAIAAVFDKADQALDAAAAKLDDAFNAWCADADAQPHPAGPTRAAIGNAAEMARRAGIWFADTKYLEPDVARAKKIDQRWKDELAGIKDQHAAALQKMTADADAAWPDIERAAHAQSGFKPADAASLKGKTVLFQKVRNRAGTDFDGHFDVEFWVDGQPVAGNFEPNVKQAFQAARKAIGGNVDDHRDWTVIAVIDGPGTVNRRTSTDVRTIDQQVVAKVEGTRPVDCTLVRVIALHAGPVAVGPP